MPRTEHDFATGIEAEVPREPSPPPRPARPPSRNIRSVTEQSIDVLRALNRCLGENEAIIVATDPRGFPLALRRIPRPRDLPSAIVLGRHSRCGLSIAADPGVSLRHLLLVLFPGRGPLRLRGVDLGGRGGVVVARDRQVKGFSAHGHVLARIGSTQVHVLPGGEAGSNLLEGSAAEVLQRLAHNATLDDSSAVVQAASIPPEMQQQGGYRGWSGGHQSLSRGTLRLRSQIDERGKSQYRDVAINAEQLRRGLLIGRYSDRCSLAGEGRNLSRVHALVCDESPESLLVFDLASTNGVRPLDQAQGPSHPVVRITPQQGCFLGQFRLEWLPPNST